MRRRPARPIIAEVLFGLEEGGGRLLENFTRPTNYLPTFFVKRSAHLISNVHKSPVSSYNAK